MAGGRNIFTDDEDNLLIKFLAKHNPTGAGRKGNALYKMLAENAENKWSFSTRHPWQSWRDRYVKNSDWFDPKIMKYQKKHGIAVKDPASARKPRSVTAEDEDEDEPTHDVTDKEEDIQRKRKRARLSEGSAAMAKRRRVKDETMVGAVDGKDKKQGGSRDVRGEKVKKEAASRLQAVNGRQNGTVEKAEGEETDDEKSDDEDVPRGPIGSDDYAAELFQESSVDELDSEPPDSNTSLDDVDAVEEIDAMLVSDDNISAVTPHEEAHKQEPLYPDIATLPSPHLTPAKPSKNGLVSMPGSYDTSGLRSVHHTPHPIKGKRLDRNQGPRPPVSNSDTSASGRSVSPPPLNASNQHVNGNGNGIEPTRTLKPKSLKPRVLQTEDTDFFESFPPSPHEPTSHTKVRRELPKLIEGPFGNTLFRKTEEERSEDEEEEAQWPPRRKRPLAADKGEEKVKAREHVKVTAKADRKEQTEKVATSKIMKNISSRHPQINATASSSRLVPNSSSNRDPSFRPSLDVADSSPSHHPFNQASQQLPLLLQYPHAQVKPMVRPTLHPIDYQRGVGDDKGKMVDPTSPSETPSGRPSNSMKIAKVGRQNTFMETRPAETSASMEKIKSKGSVVMNDEGGDFSRSRPLPSISAQQAKDDKKSLVSDDSSYPRVTPRILDDDKYRTMKLAPEMSGRSSETVGRSTSRAPIQKRIFSNVSSRHALPPSINDPFVDLTILHDEDQGKGKKKAREPIDIARRYTIGGEAATPLLQNIDSLAKSKPLLSRQSLPSQLDSDIISRLRRPSSWSTPLNMGTISIPAEHRSLFEKLGAETAIERISQDYGFREEEVMKVFMVTKNIEETDKIIKLMKMDAEVTRADQLTRWMDKQGTRAIHDVEMDEHGKLAASEKHSMASSPRRHIKRGLQYTPTSADDGPDSDYSPPKASRAGQFARLVRKGRVTEALKREERRASGGSVRPSKTRTVIGTESPEADRITDEGQVGSGGHEVMAAAGNSDDVILDGENAQEPIPKWGAEEDEMFRGALSKNEATLRVFEARTDPDFMWQKAAYLMSELIRD